MRPTYWIILALFLYISPLANAKGEELSNLAFHKTWLRLLHYQPSLFRSSHSRIANDSFFLSSSGSTDPIAELAATLIEFKKNPQKACEFPARFLFVKENLDKNFPKPNCTELDDWLKALSVKKISIGFAGPYQKNPASILGHSFIVLGRQNSELLNYAVGFSAVPDPHDNKALYMYKGLTGGYPGMYQLEPYYMRVGLYNNSEHRDLWVHELNLTESEIHFFMLHLWEVVHGVQIPYYFIDDNCSLRMLDLIDVVNPNYNFADLQAPVVLPGDTIRTLIETKKAKSTPHFRASNFRKLNYLVQQMSMEQKENYKNNTGNGDPIVLDALIETYNIKLYEKLGKLDSHESAKRDQFLVERSQIKANTIINDEDIRNQSQLNPIYQGHKTRWFTIGRGQSEATGEDTNYSEISYRSGSHAWYLPQFGYEEAANMEYLGFLVHKNDGAQSDLQYSLLILDVVSLDNTSWSARLQFTNSCEICSTDQIGFNLSAGYGIGANYKFFGAYLIPAADIRVFHQEKLRFWSGIGYRSGIRFNKNSFTLAAESERFTFDKDTVDNFYLSILYSLSLNQHLKLKFQEKDAALHYIQNF